MESLAYAIESVNRLLGRPLISDGKNSAVG